MSNDELELANEKYGLAYYPEKWWDRLFAPAGNVAMITSVDDQGTVNAASFATCVRVVHNPVQICFTTAAEGQTVRNIEQTGEFVVNLPHHEKELLEKVRVVGLPFEKGVNELDKAGLTAIPSMTVAPPRIADCWRHFECEVVWIHEWIGRKMVMGNVRACSIRTELVAEHGYIKWDLAKPTTWAGQQYVDLFAQQFPVMQVGIPYEGPENTRTDAEWKELIDNREK